MSNKIDPKFTESIVRWLDSEHTTDEHIQAGAMLLLRLNRDNAMYQRIMRRPQREVGFVEYKLRRFLSMRKDGQTIRDVIKLDSEITPQILAAVNTKPAQGDEQPDTLPVEDPAADNVDGSPAYIRKGMRPDHDRLPDNIKAIWPANAERWKKIKAAFETCKQLTEPCDRYEFLKDLKKLWYKYKEEMARYDDYRLTANAVSPETPTLPTTPTSPTPLTPDQEKDLKNADSYISKNLPALQQLVEAAKEDDFSEGQAKHLESVRLKMQQRVDVLLHSGRTLTDERREKLIQCDIRLTIDTPQDEQGNESE